MFCTLSSAYWQHASKRSALRHFELIWKVWYGFAPIYTVIIIIIIIIIIINIIIISIISIIIIIIIIIGRDKTMLLLI